MSVKTVRKPMATWWKLGEYSAHISPVKVVAFTDHFVTVLEQRSWTPTLQESRRSRAGFYPTFAEAKAALIATARKRVDAAKLELERRRGFLATAQSLEMPGRMTSQDKCTKPPAGWICTREDGHDGPCAAVQSREALLKKAAEMFWWTL